MRLSEILREISEIDGKLRELHQRCDELGHETVATLAMSPEEFEAYWVSPAADASCLQRLILLEDERASLLERREQLEREQHELGDSGRHAQAAESVKDNAQDDYVIKGKRGMLRRGQDGFSSFNYAGDERTLQFTLNDTESRIAEKLWQANKDGTKTVSRGILLKAAGRAYEKVSSVFSATGKGFYTELVDKDNKGNYWLNLEKKV